MNLKTTKKFATENELVYIFGKIPEDADFCLDYNDSTADIFKRFFEIWTLKEAYFKKIGTGISADLKSVEFLVSDDCVACNKQAKMTTDKSIDGYIFSSAE